MQSYGQSAYQKSSEGETKPASDGSAAKDTTTAQIDGLLEQLSQSLTALSEIAAFLANEPSHPNNIPLHPHARTAETSMHQLRRLQLMRVPAAAELSQSVTVLVLVADMLANGQFPSQNARDSYELLLRNTQRAIGCLDDIRTWLSNRALEDAA